jgi:DNA-directed RNA polymerase subunit RPC12/RpoP
MTTSSEKTPAVQPRPTSSILSNGFEVTLAGGYWCLDCGQTLRANDAELHGSDPKTMRLLCRECGSLILGYGPRS